MKRNMKKLTAVLLAMLMVMTTFVAFPVTASAATPDKLESSKINIWADAENVLTQEYVDTYKAGSSKYSVLGAVQPFSLSASSSGIGGGLGGLIPGLGGGSSSSSTLYLFLPSNADLSALKLWIATGSTLSINGTTIQSGVPTGVFANLQPGVATDYTFTLDGSNKTVKVMKSRDVGTIYIDTQSGSLSSIQSSKSNYESGVIMVVQPDGTVDYMGNLSKINGRGNGTWDKSCEKNPYSIKLAKSTSLLGMSKSKKWALLASTGNGADKTLIANQLAYDFSDYVGVPYQVHCKPVDLYINQQYVGSYQLAEKVEIKNSRVALETDAYEELELINGTTDPVTGAITPADLSVKPTIANNFGTVSSYGTSSAGKTPGGMKYLSKVNGVNTKEPADVTGGYIYQLEISKRIAEEENNGFAGYARQCWIIASGDYASKGMMDYSYDLFFALGASVYNGGTVPSTTTTTSVSSSNGGNTSNPKPADKYIGMKWSDLLDADSAVRYYWTQEFFKNMDATTSSTYFHKEADKADGTLSKLVAGPVWDMDNSTGHAGDNSRWGISINTTSDWYVKNTRIYRYNAGKSDNDTTAYPLAFYGALATNCADFWEMAQLYWYNTISPAVDILLGRAVDETGILKSVSYYVNTIKYSAMMDAVRFGTTYDAASVESTLQSWIEDRQSWINGENGSNSGFSRVPLSSNKITAYSIPAQKYTGAAVEPEITVTYQTTNLGTITLEEGVDYTVEYQNNVNVGTAAAKITGINGFSGMITSNFTIGANALADGSLTIEDKSYAGVEINATLTDSNGNDITDSPYISYKWFKNNDEISGATGSSYITTDEDTGSQITAKAFGDTTHFAGNITSNNCTVLTSSRPTGYTQTIAAWDYDYSLDNTTLVNIGTDTDYRYAATDGVNKTSASLVASVDADNPSQLKWSDKSTLFKNNSGIASEDRTPVMGTSKTNGVSWGFFPYFETVVSTKGFENITFSAKLGGTNKGPKYWNLQYSLDGVNYIDIADTDYAITKNKNMELAFDDVALPSDCDNQNVVYIRATVNDDVAIDGVSEIVMQQSGDAAINNVYVKGSSLSVVSSLSQPVIDYDSTTLFNDNLITITDTNGGADVYYTVNGGDAVKYTGPFNPFDVKNARIGDTVTLNAYASFNDVQSDIATVEFTFGGININSFVYTDYSKDVTAGAVQSSGGIYGNSGKMTATADGTTLYVPLWRADNGSFCVSPDDGLKWSANSGFTYKITTTGYENVNFSCMAYTTSYGPKSVSLQYSLNGTDFITIQENIALSANGELEQLLLNYDLPAACDNQKVVYLRLATTENKTSVDTALHNNLAKGNLYVNNAVIAGEDNGQIKAPYTNKSTAYFGETGTVKYISPDGLPMQYIVLDSHNNTVLAGKYTSDGISLSSVQGFDKTQQEAYTVLIEAIEDEDNKSITVSDTYMYKGDTIVKFSYNDSTRLIEDYLINGGTAVTSTSGTGTLSMYPNGTNAIALDYSNTYGVKASWNINNTFASNKVVNKIQGAGYWLIETSTKGFTNISINAAQLSSNKGPRDWAVAYSTNGTNYTFVTGSDVRAISNDYSSKPVETLGNIPLGSACDNQDTLYIKIFINGGETVDGTELDDVSVNKGNTGINSIELSGIAMPTYVEFNTTLLEHIGDASGTINVADVDIYVNGGYKATTDENGLATVGLPMGVESTVTFEGAGVARRTVKITPSDSTPTQNVAVMAYDVNGDGYVNAKDFAIISKDSSYSAYRPFFSSFINVKNDQFVY